MNFNITVLSNGREGSSSPGAEHDHGSGPPAAGKRLEPMLGSPAATLSL